MLPSKNIQDYFSVELRSFRPGTTLSYPIHVYLPNAQQIIMLRPKSEMITSEFIEGYLKKGLQTLWVHNQDREAHELYVSQNSPTDSSDPSTHLSTEKLTTELNIADPTVSDETQSASKAEAETSLAKKGQGKLLEGDSSTKQKGKLEESNYKNKKDSGFNSKTKQKNKKSETPVALLKKALESKEFTQEEKSLLAKSKAIECLKGLGPDATAESLEEAKKKIQDEIEEIVKSNDSLSGLSSFFKKTKIPPLHRHSMDVATYAVLFAMLSGESDAILLRDLAVAGLLHDIGLTQIPIELAQKPCTHMSDVEALAYQVHVHKSLEWLEQNAPELNATQKRFISEHHEKFDGTGYPNHTQGFALTEAAQCLTLADILLSICDMRWDGKKRTLWEALSFVQTLDKQRSFPQYFNPELFQIINQAVQGKDLNSIFEHSKNMVEAQEKNVKKRSSEPHAA